MSFNDKEFQKLQNEIDNFEKEDEKNKKLILKTLEKYPIPNTEEKKESVGFFKFFKMLFTS